MKIAICGCGALGSQIAFHIASPDHHFLLIDDDRIGAENVRTGTSIYWDHHVGVLKPVALGEILYRKCGATAEPWSHTLEDPGVIYHFQPDLIIDTFDNPEARSLTTHDALQRHLGINLDRIPTLHAGVSEARTGSIIWDQNYTVPDGFKRGDNPVCTHGLGRRILSFTAVTAAIVILTWMDTGEYRNMIVTERGTMLE